MSENSLDYTGDSNSSARSNPIEPVQLGSEQEYSSILKSMTSSDASDVGKTLGQSGTIEFTDSSKEQLGSGGATDSTLVAFMGSPDDTKPPSRPDDGDSKPEKPAQKRDETPVSAIEALKVNQWVTMSAGLFQVGAPKGPIADGSSPNDRPDRQLTKGELDNLINHKDATPAQKEFATFLKDNFDAIAKLGAFGRPENPPTIDIRDLSVVQQFAQGKPPVRQIPGLTQAEGDKLSKDSPAAFRGVLGTLDKTTPQPSGLPPVNRGPIRR